MNEPSKGKCTSIGSKNMESGSDTTRVPFACYSNTWSRDVGGNWTQFYHRPYLLLNLLEPLLERLGSDVEIVTELSSPEPNSTTSLPVIQTLGENRSDLAIDWFAYQHDRFQLVDYLYPFKVRGTIECITYMV